MMVISGGTGSNAGHHEGLVVAPQHAHFTLRHGAGRAALFQSHAQKAISLWTLLRFFTHTGRTWQPATTAQVNVKNDKHRQQPYIYISANTPVILHSH